MQTNPLPTPPETRREEILPAAVYLTPEAARLVRVEPSTIRHLVRTGKIRGQGRPFRILGAELLKFAGGSA